MDLVKGVPITRYCDEHRLTPRQRLELFVPVCQAMQHAHQKGIIHRDLKPSNLLVALYDGKPVPKVIDFGLAKAIHQPLTERTLHTAHDMVLGTPLYMSPEQAELNNLDIDTRSDIYSLGVRLYETATALARDIERYLAEEPVSAGPPSATYRLRKFLQRNKAPVLAAAVVLVALVAGVVGTSWGLVQARQQRDAAVKEKQRAD